MNVLLLTQVLPYPPDSGPAVKTWNVLKYLATRHDVTLVSFMRGDQSEAVAQLQRLCRAVHTIPMRRSRLRDAQALAQSLATGKPFLIIRDGRAAMRQLVDRLARAGRFDIVHADQVNMAPYATQVQGAAKIFDAHNALWLAIQRLSETRQPGPVRRALQREWRILRRYEGDLCGKFDAVITVSDADRRALEAAAETPINATVIPIAIDTHEVQLVTRTPHTDRILHVGTLLWPPNADGLLWFLNDVLPLIQRRHPDVKVDVVGTRPPRAVLAAAERQPGIDVRGFVPNLTEALQQAAVLVIPLRAGAGMRVRILNGLAQGLPIVTTSVGCEGIDVTHGEHLMIADTAQEFAAATLHLMTHPDEAAALGRRGRALIEQRYDFRVACTALDAVYESVRPR